jgi:uncharacterized membrane protein YciS (DUF1049 family)
MKGVIIMLSGKYHMGSLIAIFFALGIGILIGGSLGQKWMFQTEQHTLRILMDKYEGKLEENQKQIDLITRLRAQLAEGDMDGYTEKATSSPQSIDHHTSVE